MVRLTPELITNAPQYTNAIKDRELDLRGYKVPILENLGSTLDQFDTIDLTDNEVRKLDGFPLLKRLRCLILTENKIVRIGEDLGYQLPNLDTLILTGNKLSDLRDLDPLSTCQKLTLLSLIQCPVTLRANYRLYVISRVPSLRFLDFRRVTHSERKLARSMFKHIPIFTPNKAKSPAPRGTATSKANSGTSSVKTFIPGAPLNSPAVTVNGSNIPSATPTESSEITAATNSKEPVSVSESNNADAKSTDSDAPASATQSKSTDSSTPVDAPMPPPPGPILTGAKRSIGPATNQDLLAIQDAIKRARTMDEVESLHQLLSSGQFAGFAAQWQQQQRKQ